MPRPRGPHGREDSRVIAVRLPRALADAVTAAAGGDVNVSAWCRNVFRAAASRGGFAGAGSLTDIQRSEGWRAGWTAANRQFRAALAEVIAADTPVPE